MPDDKTVQGIKDLTSATATLLKDVGFKDAAAINVIGGVAGLVAGAASASLGPLGVAVAVLAIADQLISLLNQSSSDQLHQVTQELAKIIQAEAQQAQDTRRQYIQENMAGAASVASALNDLKNRLPLSSSDVTPQMEMILGSMHALAPQDVPDSLGAAWLVPHDYQTFWTDWDSPETWSVRRDFPGPCGYGPQPPASSGNVFNYTYALPAYLYAVSIFVSTGTLIDPNFQQNWANDVAVAASLLQSVHDYILHKGMTQLSPGAGQADDPERAFPVTGPNLNGWLSAPIIPSSPVDGYGVFLLTGSKVSIEYGAVEKFSGFSSVGWYTLQAPTIQEPLVNVSRFDANINYDGAFQIRLKRRWKDVYVGAGLKHLQNAIDSLNQLIGKPTSTGPSPGDWSFRHDIAGPAHVTRADGTLHLSDVMAYLKRTPPADPSWLLIHSFRKMLSF